MCSSFGVRILPTCVANKDFLNSRISSLRLIFHRQARQFIACIGSHRPCPVRVSQSVAIGLADGLCLAISGSLAVDVHRTVSVHRVVQHEGPRLDIGEVLPVVGCLIGGLRTTRNPQTCLVIGAAVERIGTDSDGCQGVYLHVLHVGCMVEELIDVGHLRTDLYICGSIYQTLIGFCTSYVTTEIEVI